MRYIIQDETRRRIRFQLTRYPRLSERQADVLVSYFDALEQVKQIKVYERIGSIVLSYRCTREDMLDILNDLTAGKLNQQKNLPKNSVRSINKHYRDQITERIMQRIVTRMFLPARVRMVITICGSVKYFLKALSSLRRGKVETSLLEAATLAASFIRSDYEGAGGVVFLLDLGEILEGWIQKKKVESLAETMSLNVDYVYLWKEDGDVLIPVEEVRKGDLVIVEEGNMIPFDGIIRSGEGSVLQLSMTGNALPQSKTEGDSVYAGTYLEEGEFALEVQEENKMSQYDKIVNLVENTQNLKPEFESKAITAANHLVPYLFGGSALTYLLTRNAQRACSFLMVDFAYALKLALPMAVLHAKKKAYDQKIMIKGGRFMENMADADVIVFDKTGTLTKAHPVLKHVDSFGEYSEDQLLAIAACMEEHVSNTVSRAIVDAAVERHITHEEMHTTIEQVFAHGVATSINGKRVLFGSYHFIFEDEKCPVPDGLFELLRGKEHAREHHRFLAIDHKLEGIFCVEDVLRDEISQVIRDLRETGFDKVNMLTGDVELSAREAALEAGVDEYFFEKLPDEKADYIKKLQDEGHKVIMVGDGINDSLALSVADVGIALSDGSDVSKELADVVVENENLFAIVKLRKISMKLMEQMKAGYHGITWTNAALIALGATGVISPATVSTVSNLSTLAITLGMRTK